MCHCMEMITASIVINYENKFYSDLKCNLGPLTADLRCIKESEIYLDYKQLLI